MQKHIKRMIIFIIALITIVSITSISQAQSKLEIDNAEHKRIYQDLQTLAQSTDSTNPEKLKVLLNEVKKKNVTTNNIQKRKYTFKQAYQLNVTVPYKDGIYFPQTLDQLQSLILTAKTNHLQVRVMGAGHSVKPAIFNSNNKNEIRIILSGDFRKVISITPDPSHEFATATVGAGCYLGINTADETSTLENSFNFQVDQAGFAVPTLGGISHQTVAGFLQTSSSGGSVKHGIADSIESIDWIDGNGQVHHAKKGEDEFNAVGVSMGLFGILTQVTFKLPKKYLVEGEETNHEIGDSYLAKDENGHFSKLHDALFNENEYMHINWLAQKYLNRTMQWVGKSVPFDETQPLTPYKHALQDPVIANLAVLVFGIANLIDQYASDNDILLHFKAELFKPFANPNDKQHFRDYWYKALPIDDQANVDGTIKTYFSEMWFPEVQLDTVMQKLEALLAENPKAAGNFIIELYAAKQSPFWLSPSYGHHAFRVDLYWWAANKGDPKEYFGYFWEKLLDIPGARLHWGKYLPLPGEKYGEKTFTAAQLYRSYPKFNEWLALREKMDPQQMFVTDYWRRVLDIPLPKANGA